VREKHRLRVFEDRVLGNIFWSTMEKVTLEWRKLHKEELYDMY
jgi:hypothetical protein